MATPDATGRSQQDETKDKHEEAGADKKRAADTNRRMLMHQRRSPGSRHGMGSEQRLNHDPNEARDGNHKHQTREDLARTGRRYLPRKPLDVFTRL